MKVLFVLAALETVLMSAGLAQTGSSTSSGRNDYGKPEAWLCRPGRLDACAADLTTTIIAASGKLKRETWRSNRAAPIDCFYVYPTVSNDPAPNSDMTPGPEELGVVRAQFARFGSQCRPFAPLYRQATATALGSALRGRPMTVDHGLAYGDVLDAWNHYLERDNQGRGFVLIGHSQGSRVLTQLIAEEIDSKPVRQRLVSAFLIGARLPVPKNREVGGAFQNVRLCRSELQTGCVIAYGSYRADAPPPGNARYGRVPEPGMVAACVNPAALGGGRGPLHAYLSSVQSTPVTAAPRPWVISGPPIDTPFVSVPGLLIAECVSNEKGSYLAVKVHGNPADPRADDIVGDLVLNGQVQADWGLHMVDVELAMGNLIGIVAKQARAYVKSRR